MSIKNERIKKIKNFLRIQSTAVSVTEIHEALSKRMHLDVSRKTIERDVVSLADKKVLTVIPGVPSRYFLNNPTEFEIFLKVEDIKLILGFLGPEAELSIRLKKLL